MRVVVVTFTGVLPSQAITTLDTYADYSNILERVLVLVGRVGVLILAVIVADGLLVDPKS